MGVGVRKLLILLYTGLGTNIVTTMTSSKAKLSQPYEIGMIKQDIEFYADVFISLTSKPASGVLIFGLLPYLSLFVIETYKYLQSNFPLYARAIAQSYAEILHASRTRTKFFDDANKRIDGALEHLKWIIEFNEEWHINSHKGFLAPLKRALQDDLGMFFYDNHIIGSTHVGLFNIGYERKDLPTTSLEISKLFGPLSKSVGEDLGKYLARIYSLPEFTPNKSGTMFSYNINEENLKYKDEKAKRFFNTVFNGETTLDLNFSLLLFLTTTNFFQHIFANIVTGKPTTLFKLKFITLYHLVSSLTKLRDYYYPQNILTAQSKEFIEEILKDKDLQLIKTLKDFRNILVHYKISGIPETLLNPATNLYGLTEYFSAGKTSTEVENILDTQIERISILLEQWINWKTSSAQLSRWQFSFKK
jgi:hypothetical protein